MINLDTRLQAALSSISGIYLGGLINIATTYYRLDREELLHNTGLTEEQLLSTEGHIPTYYLFNLFRVLYKTTHDASLGLHLGQHIDIKSFTTLGYLLTNAETVREGIRQLLQYQKLVNELALTTFEETEEECILRWHCPIKGEEARHFQEIALTGMTCMAQSIVSQPLTINSINFEHTPPVNAHEYEHILKCPVNFSQKECSIRLAKESMEIGIKNADPLLSKIVLRSADTILLEYKHSVSFISDVRTAIFRLLPSGNLSMEQVAKRLGISSRVVHNRLKRHNISFNGLVDEVRGILALHYIADETVSLVDIGLLLGFADQSSFTRAFKRWQGETPGDYRKSFFISTRRARSQFYIAQA